MMEKSDLDILDPEFSNRSSPEPIILEASSLSDEISYAVSLINENASNHYKSNSSREYSGCIVFCGFSMFELTYFGKENNIPVLDGTTSFKSSQIFFSDLEQMKGYEFDTVVVVNCQRSVFPPNDMPETEFFRVTSQMYVAMTRARTQLVISHHGDLSDWMDPSKLGIDSFFWNDVVEIDPTLGLSAPAHLSEVYETQNETEGLRDLNGKKFLYTTFAIGLPIDIQNQLIQAVDGVGLTRERVRRKWKTVGQLYDDMLAAEEHGRVGYFVGRKADTQIQDVLSVAFSGERAVIKKPVSEISGETISKSASVASKPRGSTSTGKPASVSSQGQMVASDTVQKLLKKHGIKKIQRIGKVDPFVFLSDPRVRTNEMVLLVSLLIENDIKWPKANIPLRWLNLDKKTYTALDSVRIHTIGDLIIGTFSDLTNRVPHSDVDLNLVRQRVGKLGFNW